MYINGGKIAYFLSCLITEYWEFEEAKAIYFSMLDSSEDYSDEELNKQLVKIQSKEIQNQHENRKKEIAFNSLQEQFRKIQKEKNSNFINVISISSQLSQNFVKISFLKVQNSLNFDL